jgi:GxxExxY protein
MLEELTGQIIGAAIEVHRELGPGLLESAYGKCLAREFDLRGMPYEKELELPINYKGILIESGFRLDFWVNREVIVELKAVENILPIHRAQVMTYLKLTQCRLALILNFNTEVMRYGIKRVIMSK